MRNGDNFRKGGESYGDKLDYWDILLLFLEVLFCEFPGLKEFLEMRLNILIVLLFILLMLVSKRIVRYITFSSRFPWRVLSSACTSFYLQHGQLLSFFSQSLMQEAWKKWLQIVKSLRLALSLNYALSLEVLLFIYGVFS